MVGSPKKKEEPVISIIPDVNKTLCSGGPNEFPLLGFSVPVNPDMSLLKVKVAVRRCPKVLGNRLL
jgi:hypothetical protein